MANTNTIEAKAKRFTLDAILDGHVKALKIIY